MHARVVVMEQPCIESLWSMLICMVQHRLTSLSATLLKAAWEGSSALLRHHHGKETSTDLRCEEAQHVSRLGHGLLAACDLLQDILP